jgi:choline dehydrogenase-like flavoprotein
MIDDAQYLSADSVSDADILIIGGGAAGISLALNFLESPIKVVVLESGGLKYERGTQSLYRGRSIGLRYEPLDLCRVRVLGGSTDRRGWAGWCKVFNEFDFEKRDWVSHSGWPITKNDLAPYYQKALETVALPTDLEELAEAEAEGSNCLPLRTGDCVNEPVPLSTLPHLSEAWTGALRASRSVRVILHANVIGIDTDDTGAKVTGVRFATLDHRNFDIKPRITVMAAGGIENARLLLSSNKTVKPGLGNSAGWVGRCFMDHPRYAWGQIRTLPDASQLLRYNPTHGAGQRRYGVPPPGARPLFGFGISLTDELQKHERLLGSRRRAVGSCENWCFGRRVGGFQPTLGCEDERCLPICRMRSPPRSPTFGRLQAASLVGSSLPFWSPNRIPKVAFCSMMLAISSDFRG